VAVWHFKAGQQDRATQLFDQAQQVGSEPGLWRSVAQVQQAAGLHDQAQALAGSIKTPGERDLALKALALSFLESQEVDRAVKIASQIGNQEWQDQVIGLGAATPGPGAGPQDPALQAAQVLVDKAEETGERLEALVRLGVAQHQVGAKEDALNTVEQAGKLAKGEKNKCVRSSYLLQVAVGLGRIGEAEQAATLARQGLDLQKKELAKGKGKGCEAVRRALEEAASLGGDSCQGAMDLAELRELDRRMESALAVAENCLETGPAAAQLAYILARAWQVVQATPSSEKAPVLAQLAQLFARSGAYDKGLDLAGRIPELSNFRINALFGVVDGYMEKTGQPDGSPFEKQLLSRVIALVPK
jgi:tetratricopeptide (TPR) repeat protein